MKKQKQVPRNFKKVSSKCLNEFGTEHCFDKHQGHKRDFCCYCGYKVPEKTDRVPSDEVREFNSSSESTKNKIFPIGTTNVRYEKRVEGELSPSPKIWTAIEIYKSIESDGYGTLVGLEEFISKEDLKKVLDEEIEFWRNKMDKSMPEIVESQIIGCLLSLEELKRRLKIE